MVEMSKSSINFLRKKWKDGEFLRYDANPSTIIELKRFGIISFPNQRGLYVINKKAYGKLTDGKQEKLPKSLNRTTRGGSEDSKK